MKTRSHANPGGWTSYRPVNEVGAEANSVTTELIDILDALDIPIVVVRSNFTIACFNDAAAAMLNLDPSHVGRAPNEIILLTGIPDLQEWCAQATTAGAPSRHNLYDGQRSFVLRVSPYTRGNGPIAGAVLTFTNVTAFYESLNQAIHERENAKAILNTVTEPLFVLSHDLRVQTANRAFYAMLQVSREQAQNVPLAEFGNRAFDVPGLPAQLQETLAGNREFLPFEITHDFPAIGPRTVMVNACQLSLPGKSRRMILLGLQDVTERKRAEEVKQRLSSIVENSYDAIVSTDLSGIITSWNKGAEHLFGYTAEEAVGEPITRLIPPERHDEEPEILGRIRRGERVEHYETVRMRRDGGPVDISLTVSPVKDANGKVIGASSVARDISERKKANACRELLTQEIHHRTKNLFAVVQAVVGRSFAGTQTVEEAKSAVLSRLASLAQTHVMLIDKRWEGADIGEIVGAEMAPFAGRVEIEGSSVTLNPKAAQNICLALHELATNAAKYGALSCATGWVHISWSVSQSGGSRAFAFRWQERGGPPVTKPERKGFGTTVLERVMADFFSEPRMEFSPTGVSYELNAPLDAVVGTGPHTP